MVYGLVDMKFLSKVNVGADHRVLDGATVARFYNKWKLFIEEPKS